MERAEKKSRQDTLDDEIAQVSTMREYLKDAECELELHVMSAVASALRDRDAPLVQSTLEKLLRFRRDSDVPFEVNCIDDDDEGTLGSSNDLLKMPTETDNIMFVEALVSAIDNAMDDADATQDAVASIMQHAARADSIMVYTHLYNNYTPEQVGWGDLLVQDRLDAIAKGAVRVYQLLRPLGRVDIPDATWNEAVQLENNGVLDLLLRDPDYPNAATWMTNVLMWMNQPLDVAQAIVNHIFYGFVSRIRYWTPLMTIPSVCVEAVAALAVRPAALTVTANGCAASELMVPASFPRLMAPGRLATAPFPMATSSGVALVCLSPIWIPASNVK